MKRFVLFIAGLLCLFTCVIAFQFVLAAKKAQNRNQSMIVPFGQITLHVDIAATDAKRKLGLGNRDRMSIDQGMLFVFPVPGQYEFWMKDMNFPLDIIWLNKGVVVDIATLPPPKPGEELPRHTPKTQADRVLEVTAGLSKKQGIGIGSVLRLPAL